MLKFIYLVTDLNFYLICGIFFRYTERFGDGFSSTVGDLNIFGGTVTAICACIFNFTNNILSK